MADSLISRFQNPPRMSVAANSEHLFQLLYALIAEGATELNNLYGELERLTGPLVADRGSENERLSAEVARLQQELEVARRDGGVALDLLAILFDAIENGDPCYENPDETEGYLGAAVHLDDDTFTRCAGLLNERRPNAIAAIDAAREG